MKLSPIAIAILTASTSAGATNYGNFNPDPGAEANSSSSASSTSSSRAIGVGVGLGLGIGQGGNARATGGNARVGNTSASVSNTSAGGTGGLATAQGGAGGTASSSNSLTFNTPGAQSVRYSGSIRSVPDLALGAAPSTALCIVAGGVGGSGVGFGFGVNGGVTDWNCVRMLVATSAAMPTDVRAIAIEGIRADLLAHMPKRRETGSATPSTVAFGE